MHWDAPRDNQDGRTSIGNGAAEWKFFRELAPTYRRDFVVWIHIAKRPETRARRIRESISLLAAGRSLA